MDRIPKPTKFKLEVEFGHDCLIEIVILNESRSAELFLNATLVLHVASALCNTTP